MKRTEIQAMTDKALRAIVATANPTGFFTNEVAWAKSELARRGVDYSDCLEPEATEDKLPIGTIDCTPSWSATLPVLLLGYADGTPQGRAMAQVELTRMARLADLYVAAQAVTS